jgi:hypothetical protein
MRYAEQGGWSRLRSCFTDQEGAPLWAQFNESEGHRSKIDLVQVFEFDKERLTTQDCRNPAPPLLKRNLRILARAI